HPHVLAFYQTKKFGDDRWSIRWYAEVRSVERLTRRQLLPKEPDHPRANAEYYCLRLGSLQRREQPIPSRALRRVTFIPTIWRKFQQAEEINDLWNESPLEDTLWSAFKYDGIVAERQFVISEAKTTYILDFAVACDRGQLDVECDGDTWHLQPDAVRYDKRRSNWLESRGWKVLRFDSREIEDEMPKCRAQVKATITNMGGLPRSGSIPRVFRAGTDNYPEQLELW
ncbi:MAG: DUF559 domain-containing protein, partial [Chloroflexi bacterium]|nr:DUF559 domain-containing protein [Chloroflexota bacterium]